MEMMGSPWQCRVGFLVGKTGIIMILQSAAGVKSGHLETNISSEASEVSVAYIPLDALHSTASHSSIARKERRCRC